MKKIFLSKFLFLVIAAAAINAAAQTTAEKLPLDSAISQNQNSLKIDDAAPFDSEKFKVNRAFNKKENPLPQQSTYVRPTKDQRVKRYLSDAFGVPAVIGSTFGATINQIGNDPPEWRRSASGFGKRFASSYATNAIRNSVSFGIAEAFKLENRFQKSGQKNFGKRLKHTFIGSYTTRTKTGKRIVDFPHFIGTYSAAIIANETWMPNRFSYKDGLREGTISLGIRFGVNLLREFIFPK